jgi:membrane-associated protein
MDDCFIIANSVMIQVGITGPLQNILGIFDAESLIRYGGLLIILIIVYGNTGLFFCFFLPSGAVLFAAGVWVATGRLHIDIFFLFSLLILASLLGNMTGYWFGRKAGPSLYRRKDSRFFRRQYLTATEEFYAKHGRMALVAGFFLPIIRTFSPILAGVIGLKIRRFILYSLAGSLLWIVSFVAAGYFIGSRPFLKPWLKYIVLVFIILVTIPLVVRIVKELKKVRK